MWKGPIIGITQNGGLRRQVDCRQTLLIVRNSEGWIRICRMIWCSLRVFTVDLMRLLIAEKLLDTLIYYLVAVKLTWPITRLKIDELFCMIIQTSTECFVICSIKVLLKSTRWRSSIFLIVCTLLFYWWVLSRWHWSSGLRKAWISQSGITQGYELLMFCILDVDVTIIMACVYLYWFHSHHAWNCLPHTYGSYIF